MPILTLKGLQNGPAQRLYCVGVALTVALLIAPFTQLKYVPFSDYSSHVVRAFIIFHYHEVRAFQDTYRIVYEPIPNIASDLLIVLLLRVTNLLVAARIVIILVVIIYAIGCHLLAAQIHGRKVWSAIPCMFSVYSTFLMWGFVNYVLGLGLFMITSACWLRWKNSWTVPRYLVVTLLVLASYLTHLSAYISLVAALGTLSVIDLLSHGTTTKELVKMLGVLLPPAFLFVTFMIGSGTVGDIEWNSVTGKVINLFAFVRTYNAAVDVCIVAVIVTSWVILVAGSTRLQLVWPVTITAVVFLGLYAACPLVLFTSHGADARFVPVAMLLFVLSIRVEASRFKKVAVCSILLAVLVLRVILVWSAWARFDNRMNDAAVLAATIPPEARVYPIWYSSDCVPVWQETLTRWIRTVRVRNLLSSVASDECKKRDIPFVHVVEYAMVNSQIVTPSLHAHKGQQPLIVRNDPQYRGSGSSSDLRWIDSARGYDFVWSYALPDTVRVRLLSVAELVSESGKFRLWKIRNSKPIPAAVSNAGGSINTYYVDPVNGSDSKGNGRTAATAWATLCKADATATLGSDGTVIHLLPGTFTLYLQGACVNRRTNSPILGTLNGTPTQRVVWIGQNDPRKSTNSTILNGGNASNLYISSNYSDFIQLEVIGTQVEFGDNPGTSTLGNFNSWQKSYFHDSYTTCATISPNSGAGAIYASYSSHDGLIDSNVIDNVGVKGGCPGVAGTGIHGIYIGGYHYQVTNNLVSNAAGYGIHSYHDACESNISNNTVVHNYAGGILVSAGPDTSYGCNANGGNWYTVDNNILYLNSWGCGVIASGGNAGVQGGMIVFRTGSSAVNNVGDHNYLIGNWYGTGSRGCTGSPGANNAFVGTNTNPPFIGDPAITLSATTLPASSFVAPCPSSTWNSTACNVVPIARGGSYDWHLSANSPFRGIGGSRCAGTPGAVSPCVPTHDFDGTQRLMRTSIGAHE